MAVTATAAAAVTAASAAAAAATTTPPAKTTHGGKQPYVGALLRPFDPGKGCQRDATRGKAVLGVDLPFDPRKARGECSMEGDGFCAEGEFLAFI